MKFIQEITNNVNEKNEKNKTIIMASPVASGKTACSVSSFYLQYLKNSKMKNQQKLMLVTCPNKLVLEEMIKNCNAEEEISYWYAYDHQIIPSLVCLPLYKKGKIKDIF